MNKKLLAAAVAAAVVAAPAAFAESTVYGKMHTSVDMIDYESSNEDNWEMNSRASRLGFKGSEDLGNGLKAIYQIELQVNSGGGSDGQGSTSFLGRPLMHASTWAVRSSASTPVTDPLSRTTTAEPRSSNFTRISTVLS